MKTRTFTLATLLALTISGQAQTDTDTAANKSQFVLYANFGVQMPEYSKLNTLLADNDFATLARTNFSTGGGFYTLYPRSRVATMTSLFVYEQTSAGRTSNTSIKGTGVGATFGYAIINRSKIQVLPYAGTMFTWLNMSVFSIVPNNTTWSNYLTGTANQYEMAGTSFLADIGVQGTFSFIIDKDTGQKLTIGLRYGYYIPMTKTIWTMYETELKDGPKINPGGLYAGVIIGILK